MLNFRENRGIFGQIQEALTPFPVKYQIYKQEGRFLVTCTDSGPLAESPAFSDYSEAVKWGNSHFMNMVKKYWPNSLNKGE